MVVLIIACYLLLLILAIMTQYYDRKKLFKEIRKRRICVLTKEDADVSFNYVECSFPNSLGENAITESDCLIRRFVYVDPHDGRIIGCRHLPDSVFIGKALGLRDGGTHVRVGVHPKEEF